MFDRSFHWLDDPALTRVRCPTHDFLALPRFDYGLGERVNGDIPAEKLGQNRAKNEYAHTFERKLVKFSGDLHSPNKGDRSRDFQPSNDWLSGGRNDSFDQFLRRAIGGVDVKAEHFPQSVGALVVLGVLEGKIIQRKMPVRAPGFR